MRTDIFTSVSRTDDVINARANRLSTARMEKFLASTPECCRMCRDRPSAITEGTGRWGCLPVKGRQPPFMQRIESRMRKLVTHQIGCCGLIK